MSYKTTKKDFQEFKKEAWYWIEYFGLKSWEYDFRHEKTDFENARAEYTAYLEARYVCIRLNITFAFKPNLKEIRSAAFHEICHLLLIDLSQLSHKT